MTSDRISFDQFTFDAAERELRRGSTRVDISGRYLDALGLLLREHGRLVTKERFMDEVWRGVPVTDEALTQCIRTLRRELGDEAARPRFIETVPKHGYRFIAATSAPASVIQSMPFKAADILRMARMGGIGGAVAGIGGGLFYGFAASGTAGTGATSMLMVMLAVSVLLGLIAGVGVGAGIGAAEQARIDRWQVTTAGGMVGGLVIGGFARLIGLDAFSLLFGRAPTGMTGPAEGALLGAALGLAVWLSRERTWSVGRSTVMGGIAGAGAGLLTPLLGGHLLGGSLNLLTLNFPDGSFRLDAIGALFGESGFGPVSEAFTAAGEGALFGLGVGAALALACRHPRDADARLR